MNAKTTRTAIITGGARGIGRATAEVLAARGDRLILIDLLEDALAATQKELSASGAEVRILPGDVTDPALAQQAVAFAQDAFGSLDILINNAGISPKRPGTHTSVAEITLAEWLNVMDVNLTSVFLFSQAASEAMKTDGWGRIVNLSSQAARGRSGIPAGHYTASKAAVLGFSRTLAAELAPFGITVNSVAPGRIRTDMTAMSGDAINNEIATRIPVGMLGEPNDIAAAVAYLSSEEARYVTGAVIDVNGGFLMP